MFPRYTHSPRAVFGLAANVFFGGQRSFQRDGQACLGRLDPPLRVFGEQNIPRAGPCLITFNHYYRPGFQAWWMALALAAVVPAEVHFVMTGELTFCGKWYASLGKIGSRWLLRRVGRIYGFTTMPPMPPRLKDVEARARAVRAAMFYAREHPRAILGLAPEGGDQPGGLLTRPPAGAGRFIALLAGSGFKIVPVGVYEENGNFCLRFGMLYDLDFPPGFSADERDARVAQMVMKNIAVLMPARLRGEFGY